MEGFDLYPAVDIRGGRCVRLMQGDYARETDYGDPVEMALHWRSQGAGWLHLVDLDGAREGTPVNVKTLSAIIEAVDIPVQIGGGLRTRRDLEMLLALGADRLIIGTVAVEDLAALRDLVRGFEARVAVGLDARDGLLRSRGWRETAPLELGQVLPALEETGISHIIHTDIGRDGTLDGYNVQGLRALAGMTNIPVIASGGVASLADIAGVMQLAQAGVDGAIIGRALYTGGIDLGEALRLVREA
ncbi:MAG: 1-(5-phosphoribosyl)-5-[(5-phosphoribosylamino)methylideneamino]imidazole-4-carboxamide isomerase [Candidatus Geothermincolia bacterium]